ncbi:hypothetical protein PV328_000282 [Microctonus aethiopoides]|uniref:Uncharacterized protein n=1 Tax=Microctonus aethiopoides TaxID=144406 RepID=A0AA39FUK7_9HYME|nr:hypothetical protein PV328_000282 [Microctonus aethiopoides]
MPPIRSLHPAQEDDKEELMLLTRNDYDLDRLIQRGDLEMYIPRGEFKWKIVAKTEMSKEQG